MKTFKQHSEKKPCNHVFVNRFTREWNDDHTFTDTDFKECKKCHVRKDAVTGEKNPEKGYGQY